MTDDQRHPPPEPRSADTTVPKLVDPTPEEMLHLVLTATNHLYYALSLFNALLPDGHGLDTTVDIRNPNPKTQTPTPQESTL